MKVLICIPCLLTGGTEIQTLNLVRALVSGGHRVVTACYFEHTLEMVERYKTAGSEVVLFEPTGKRIGGWRGVLFLYRHLRQCVRKYKPDIAHVQYMAPGATPCLILKLLGVRTIFATAHTDARIYRSLRLLHFLQRQVIDVFTCITLRAEREFFGSSLLYKEEIKLPPHAHITIYNALPESIQLNSFSRKLQKTVTIGVVSRLETIKGMDLVLPAFFIIHEKNPNTRLLVVGDGSQRPLMEQQANQGGLDHVVDFTGRQPQEILWKYYDQIDILLMPSRSEGFGLTAIEAMARGCVVVAADIGGLSEVVCHEEVGMLHQCNDIQDIADKVNRLINSPIELCRMSKNAVIHASIFSMEKYKSLIKNLYNQFS